MKKRKYNVIPQMFDVKPTEMIGDHFAVAKQQRKYQPIITLNKKRDHSSQRKDS